MEAQAARGVRPRLVARLRRLQQALGGASWQQHLRNMSTADGLHADCSRALKELRQMVSLYAATKQRVLVPATGSSAPG